jgi:hypothetical protein
MSVRSGFNPKTEVDRGVGFQSGSNPVFGLNSTNAGSGFAFPSDKQKPAAQ